jgi:hypothetical protein
LTPVQRVHQKFSEDNDMLLLIQRFNVEVMSDDGDPAEMEVNQNPVAADMLLKDRIDVVECALIRYFEGPEMHGRSDKEADIRKQRLRDVQAANPAKLPHRPAARRVRQVSRPVFASRGRIAQPHHRLHDRRWQRHHHPRAGQSQALNRGQRLLQVGQQVVAVLDADRQAHRIHRHAGFRQLFLIELAVRGGGRMAGQRLGVADIDQAREQLERILEARAALDAAFDAKVSRPDERPPRYLRASAWSRGLPGRRN